MDKIIPAVRNFLNGRFYPISMFVMVLIAHIFSIELFTTAFIFATVSIGFILCDDLKFLISPLIMFILMFSEDFVSSDIYFSKPYSVAIIISSTVLLSLFVIHFVLHRKKVCFSSIFKSKLFIGFISLCIAFLLNGFLNFDNYKSGNIFYALILVLSFGVVFFLFYINLHTQSIKEYLFFVLYLVSILVTLQLFIAYTDQIQLINGEINKESILLGWGMWNNIGGILAFLLPIHFYYATTVKKWGWLFYASGVISFLAIVLTLSRSSLLVSSFIIIACAIISCCFGCNKKLNIIITIAIGITGILGIVLLWDKISNILGDYLARGFDDNGRYEIYKNGINNFLSHPVFGGGFYSVKAQEHQFIAFLPDRCHNTIVQLLSSCGVAGLLSYSYHRFETIKLLCKSKSLYTVFASLCLTALLLTSLLDNHFFNIYPGFIYSLILVVIDKTNQQQ